MSENVLGRTERGFGKFGEFHSQWHGEIRVQESSMAFRGACAWVFCELAYSNTPKENPPALHLKYDEVVALRDALNRFLGAVKDGETTEPSEAEKDE